MNPLLEKPRKIYVSRKMEFNAAHRLFNPELSDEENSRIYGKCSNEYGHGHNYELEITLYGTIDRRTGFLFDLKELKCILEDEISVRFDHRHLNYDVAELRGCIPTTEVLAVLIWDILEQRLEQFNNREISLYEVKLYETGKNAVRYLGE
ncbi:MAG: 6-carboxytetrahydropterin synthase [Chlorobium sp.]|jgi:6-pyruvoyltetrahydropterin/6-carboxytetrahydropterin synthase|uniref:6-carboxytetrahydropterin synthase n=1 Tax=Chlorobium sp. TaxID=1095 RepID=UPI001D3F729A|nr:6-carboxytetrahydropterin synthase [Chlorobium sp.]MBN1278300.1 6-carboxytetrahydropterin synthase [Chlorobiaceae bacterium]MCF8216443.1 6-carboxytetrahydropterin synthase [Chlorobium sp.]MCF8271346.1 6-carboxytetrahydropterin synthase [Chlorobium sp.]MCF8287720.1 6-carboxytetrahydropterin synthase [Chlorobium sp.]MCF8291259.1 6-carboxytetrahydropterin synthase [Chlorobium sp.]